MNIPQDTLQQVADEAFLPSSKIRLTTSTIFDDWKNQAKDRRAVIQHALDNPALAPFLAGVGEYTDEELAHAGNAAWESNSYFGLPWLRSFLAALPRRESPALAEATPQAEVAIIEEQAWVDPVCGCIRSPDAPKDSPCPICKPAAQVPLGPEDCPPGSVFRHYQWKAHSFRYPKEVNEYGVHWTGDGTIHSQPHNTHMFEVLMNDGWQINTSIPDTGRWDKDAWRPCSKPAK